MLTNWTVGQTDAFRGRGFAARHRGLGGLVVLRGLHAVPAELVQRAPFEDPEDFKARSPITYVEKITTPMMFILGEADWRTPPGAGGEADVSCA